MKKKLIQLLSIGRPLSINQIEAKLQIKTAKQFTLLMKLLNQLVEEGKVLFEHQLYSLTKLPLSPTSQGTIKITKKLNGYIDNTDVVIPFEDLNGALDGDLVEYTNDGIVISIINHTHKYISGTLIKKRKSLTIRPDDNKIYPTIEIINCDSHLKDNGKKAITEIVSYNPLKVKINEILGDPNLKNVDIYSILANHDILPDFSKEALAQADLLPNEVASNDLNNRKDLTNILHVTIDGDDAKDFDDAVSLIVNHDQTYTLYVSIADVSHYVTFGSPIDDEAYNRATSVYAGEVVVPMLPEKLCNNLCSLRPNEIRLTQTCQIELDHNGNVLSYLIYPSYICSKKRLTYSQVNNLFKTQQSINSQIDEMLLKMNELSKKVFEIRHQNGSLDFESNETEYLFKDGKVIDLYTRVQDEAERLIENFMILANICVAHEMNTKKIPSIYRIHENPPTNRLNELVELCKFLGYKVSIKDLGPKTLQKILEDAKDKPYYQLLSSKMLKTMAKARYDAQCYYHFGLALNEYLHFTSPIRRYPDLIVHRMLRKYLYENNKIDQDDKIFCNKAATQSSIRERKAQSAEFAVDDYLKAEYMSQFIGQNFEVMIQNITNHGLYVRLDNSIEGLVGVEDIKDDFYNFNPTNYTLEGLYTHRKFSVGQKIMVKCILSDKYDPLIRFSLIEGKEDNHGKKTKRSKSTRRK